ncbi:TPA: restriction endonuclease subunit S [Campylobacter coli]|nr:restriction endonuclease subunit S [Campylobacter coli]
MKNFKDSGIEWLGEIPEHWEIVKLKYLGNFQNGISINSEAFGAGYPFVSYGDVYNNISIPFNVKGLVNSTEIDRKVYSVKQGDIFFTRTSETIDEIGISSVCLKTIENAVFAGFLIRFRAYKKILDNNFTKFYFRRNLNQYFFAKENGLVTRASLSQELLGKLPVIIPPLKEQEQIANFLDEKCEQIANFIEKKEKLISLLKEQKQALINETITKGLDKNVNFKDSGIEWLEEIPQHWNILKLKHIASLRNQKSNNIDFRIGLENIESKTGKFIPSSEVVFEEDGIGFKKGDILFGKLRPYLAKVFLTDRDGICVSEFLVLKIKSESNKFIKFLMLSSLFIDIVDSSTYGTKMPRANWEFIGNLKIPLPPPKEQEQIAKFLDEKCEKIDLLIEKTKKQIKLIKEYKTTLINQAVCGRIDL